MTRFAARLVIALFLASCGTRQVIAHTRDGSQTGGDQLSAIGTLSPASERTVPASAKVLVVWRVIQPVDRYYKFGEGTSTGGRFRLNVSRAPPAEALNNGNTGVGLLLLVEDTVSLADGPVDGSLVLNLAIGAAGDQAIVYRRQDATWPAWVQAFPVGYACASGGSSGNSPHSLTPRTCSDLNIAVDNVSNIGFADWM